MKRCPNCKQLIDGEAGYVSETGIRHCGCYWSCDPMAEVTCLNDVELELLDAMEAREAHVQEEYEQAHPEIYEP